MRVYYNKNGCVCLVFRVIPVNFFEGLQTERTLMDSLWQQWLDARCRMTGDSGRVTGIQKPVSVGFFT